MLNPTAWNWKAKSGFFWAGLCFLCAVWTYFRLPEPKGRTYGELDILFENKISARKFKSTAVESFQQGSSSPDWKSQVDGKERDNEVATHVESTI
jgi:SP family general alpha glucoside:H+ symporter-like MFS transporter